MIVLSFYVNSEIPNKVKKKFCVIVYFNMFKVQNLNKNIIKWTFKKVNCKISKYG